MSALGSGGAIESGVPAVSTATALATTGFDDATVLRRLVRDLAAVLALPAMWNGREPADIAESLLDVLVSLLRLDCAYARFDDPAGGPAIDDWRPRTPEPPAELGNTRETVLKPSEPISTISVSTPSGHGAVRVAAMYPGFPGESGVVLAGSRRPDFPTEVDQFLLRVAVDQATVAVHGARLLAREQTARALAEAAVRSRDELLASISHDLKNPLGVIKGQAQILSRRLRPGRSPDPGRLAAGLETIDATTGRMATLIDELLDVARLQAGQPLDLERQPVDLVALARRCAEDHRRTTERHAVRVEAAIPSLVGAWDRHRLERMLANLLANAIKYSPDGGEIVVRVGREEDADGTWGVLAVRDGGIGIPAADLPRVFERFHRAANVAGRIEGTGLGLAGARWIVEQHGGTIGVESDEGTGSTFTVRLPLAADSVAGASPNP